MSALPVPTGTTSHLPKLFDRMYESYSREPLPEPTLDWSLGSATIASLFVSGVTATLYLTDASSVTHETQFNLAWKTSGGDIVPPTLDDLSSFLTTGGYINVYGLSSATGALAALLIPEGYYVLSSSSTQAIPIATGINYIQMRIMALVFDMISADTANFFSHLSVGGAQGMWLSWVGDFYGVKQLTGEDVDSYRRRIIRTLAQPEENNVAIASLVSQSFGVPTVLALDSIVFHCVLYVFGSLTNPRLVMPYTRSIAPAGIVWTGVEIPPGGSLTGALAGGTLAGTTTPLGGTFVILTG